MYGSTLLALRGGCQISWKSVPLHLNDPFCCQPSFVVNVWLLLLVAAIDYEIERDRISICCCWLQPLNMRSSVTGYHYVVVGCSHWLWDRAWQDIIMLLLVAAIDYEIERDRISLCCCWLQPLTMRSSATGYHYDRISLCCCWLQPLTMRSSVTGYHYVVVGCSHWLWDRAWQDITGWHPGGGTVWWRAQGNLWWCRKCSCFYSNVSITLYSNKHTCSLVDRFLVCGNFVKSNMVLWIFSSVLVL